MLLSIREVEASLAVVGRAECLTQPAVGHHCRHDLEKTSGNRQTGRSAPGDAQQVMHQIQRYAMPHVAR